jgi:hypothetical protein
MTSRAEMFQRQPGITCFPMDTILFLETIVSVHNFCMAYLCTWGERQERSTRAKHRHCTICPSRCSSIIPSRYHENHPSLCSRTALLLVVVQAIVNYHSQSPSHSSLPQLQLILPDSHHWLSLDLNHCCLTYRERIHEMARLLSLCDLPPELILDSLSRVDYTPGCLNTVRLVCRNFNKILQRYEHSLAINIIRLQFPPNVLAKHPGLYETRSNGFKSLDELYVRLHTLFRLERNCHSIRRREGKEAAWMRVEWINLQQAGMHLLYRLCDAGKYPSPSTVMGQTDLGQSINIPGVLDYSDYSMDVDYGLGQRGSQMDLIEAGSSSVQSDPVQSNPVQSNPVQSNPVQSNPVQSNPVQSNPVQSGPTRSVSLLFSYMTSQIIN